MSDTPAVVKRAAWRFRSQRADYYRHFAEALDGSAQKLRTLLELDAQRYEGQPRGVLSAHWLERLDAAGGSLAQAWRGTLPDDEVAVLRVLEGAGNQTLIHSLHELARMADVTQSIARMTRHSLAAAAAGLSVAAVMGTQLPVHAVAMIREGYGIEPQRWLGFGRAMAVWAEMVSRFEGAALVLAVLALTWAAWSLQHWTGPLREICDRHLLPYRVHRELAGAQFLMTLGALCSQHGHPLDRLRTAVSELHESSTSPWRRMRYAQVLERIDDSGALDCAVFDTGLLNPHTFWFLRDVEQGRGFAEAFARTGQHIQVHLLPRVEKQLARWRMALLLTGVLVALAMVVWINVTIFEMKTVAMAL